MVERSIEDRCVASSSLARPTVHNPRDPMIIALITFIVFWRENFVAYMASAISQYFTNSKTSETIKEQTEQYQANLSKERNAQNPVATFSELMSKDPELAPYFQVRDFSKPAAKDTKTPN